MDILNFNTLPRESGTLLGLSFYNIVVKPMIKMTKKSIEDSMGNTNERITKFYKEAVKQTFKVWLKVELNNTQNIFKLIDEFFKW